MKTVPCAHLQAIATIRRPAEMVCEECIKTGDRWVHLRTCQICGQTHCCDSSPNKHATAHFHDTGHAVIASAEAGERWMWCYEDEKIHKY